MGPYGAPFFVFTDSSALADELAHWLLGIDKIAALWRCDQYREAELKLLVQLASNGNDLHCLVLLSLCINSLNRSEQYRCLMSICEKAWVL